MKFNITKREIRFFFLGILTLLLIDSAYNWKDFVKGFKDGYNSIK